LALLLLAPIPGRAEEAAPPAAAIASPPAPAATESARELGGHTFMPALGIAMPFATTSFGTWLSLGAGSTTGRITLQLPGSPPPAPQVIEGKVSYAAIGGVLAWEYAFLPWLSARVGFSETLYSGITGAAAAVVGTNARIGLGAGLTAGMKLGETVRVAAVLDASYAPRFGLLLGPAIRSAYQSCQAGLSSCTFDVDQLFSQKNVFELQPGVSASWAPLRALGVTGNLSYVYSQIASNSAGTPSGHALSAGAAVDFDLREVSSAPLGLQLTWNSFVPISGGGSNRYTDLGGGIFYTGRKDLSLGLQLIDRRFRVAPDVDVSWTTFVALIGMRYYF
jgi:hypothetical protein